MVQMAIIRFEKLRNKCHLFKGETSQFFVIYPHLNKNPQWVFLS